MTGKCRNDFRNLGKLVQMTPGGYEVCLNAPQIMLHKHLHVALNSGTWWLGYDERVYSSITSFLRKQFCFPEWFGAMVFVSKSSVKKIKIEDCFLYHSPLSKRDEKSVLQTTFLNLVAPENQINVYFIYEISWILWMPSPVADYDKPSKISP